jgi:hypothetical protein
MPVPKDKLEVICEAIGRMLTDAQVDELVDRATGKDVNNSFASPNDARQVRIRKTLEALEEAGQERLLLTYVLIRPTAKESLCRKIVESFPDTLINLPQADGQVVNALTYLQELLNSPLPQMMKSKLRPKRPMFSEIVQGILRLFAYKDLHEGLLKLLFTLNVNEQLLANPVDHLAPNLDGIVRQIDQVAAKASTSVAALGADAQQENAWIAQLPGLSAALRAAAGAPDAAAKAIDDIQRLVRLNLSRLNGKIFAVVQAIPFDALIRDPPDTIEDRAEFKNLVQAMRDLTATILARALKNKLWQDAENQISLINSYFDSPDDTVAIVDDWYSLRDRVDWLARLDPNEQWTKDEKKYGDDINDELSKQEKSDEDVKTHFETYRNWFRGPFQKIDDTLTQDYGSLTRIPDPLTKILNELGK